MISTHWLQQREPYWRRLETLLDRTARQGVRTLTRAELRELGLLYRQIATDLAVVREDRGSGRFAGYLNQLLARAHHTIYAAERQAPLATVRSAVRAYPALFRRNLLPCLLSLGLFLGAALLGAALAYRDPDFKLRVLGPEMVETIERREMWTHSIVGMKPVASSQIMTNNMTVSLSAFAMGITGGVGTFYMIAFNGLLLGVIGMACALAGMGLQLWSFVAPHGALELPSIVIAGGAGFRLARGVLFPGVRPRRESIVTAGGEAVRLTLGCLPILVVAGVIEAFVSPTDLPVSFKFALSAALLVLLGAYLFWTPASTGAEATDDRAA